MTPVVLDCSAALSLVLPDESSARVHRILARGDADATRLLVPSLWWFECTNVLLTAARKRRIRSAEAREALSLLSRLPHETHDAASLVAAVHLSHLGSRFEISAYDAAYLALAEIAGGALLSLDARLRKAASELGVPLL